MWESAEDSAHNRTQGDALGWYIKPFQGRRPFPNGVWIVPVLFLFPGGQFPYPAAAADALVLSAGSVNIMILERSDRGFYKLEQLPVPGILPVLEDSSFRFSPEPAPGCLRKAELKYPALVRLANVHQRGERLFGKLSPEMFGNIPAQHLLPFRR